MEESEKRAYDKLIEQVQNGVEESLNGFERAALGSVYSQVVFVDCCKLLAEKSKSGELNDNEVAAELKGSVQALIRLQEEIKSVF